MTRSTRFLALTGIALATQLVTSSPALAGRAVVSAQAGVRVWIEGGDVFPGYEDVAIWLRADRDCYATLFLVDTDGYVHVLYPASPYEQAWFYGDRPYCYRACDLGLDRLDGAGIAYVFAVGSPVPFDYTYFGASVFVGGFGFRVYGDPFVACRDFYTSLLPPSCRWDYVGVSYARFYVREWVRYPSYLCHGGRNLHVHVGDSCRRCDDVYVSYRNSCASPHQAFAPKFKRAYTGGVDRVESVARASVGRVERVRGASVKPAPRASAKSHERTRVVSTSRVAHNVERVSRASLEGTQRAKDRSASRAKASAPVRDFGARERVIARADKTPSKSVASTQARSATREKGAKKKVRQAQ
jgi:hypothetical protein